MWGSSLGHFICEVPAWGIPYVRFQLGASHMWGSSLEHSICEVPAWSIPYVRSTLYVYTNVRFRSPEFEMLGSELVLQQMLGSSKGCFDMLGSEVVEPNISWLCKLKPIICFNIYLGDCRKTLHMLGFRAYQYVVSSYVRLHWTQMLGSHRKCVLFETVNY